MRTESAVDDLDDDEIDDTFCTRQKPRKRCCIVWHQVGSFTVLACTHCPRVKRSYESEPGDAERIKQSRENHELRCVRLFWTIPAQRSPRRAPVSAPSASRTPSTTGR